MRTYRALLALSIMSLVVAAPAAYMGSYQWTTITNPSYNWVQEQVWVNGYWQYSSDWLNAYTCNWNTSTVFNQFNDQWVYNYYTGRYEDVKYIYIPR